MGARQSKSLPSPDQYNPELPSPFDSLPLHLIANIFAQITDVGSKMRLSRVCDRFRSCIQLEESWRLNTELKSHELQSPESVLAFIKYVPEVKSLDLHLPDNPGWLQPQVSEHAAKLRLTRLRVSGSDGDPGALMFLDQCVQYFGPTLRHMRIKHMYSSSAATVLTNVMAKCSSLEEVYFKGSPNQAVLRSLEGKPLRILKISHPQQFDGGLIASLINSVPGHTLHTMETPHLEFANPVEFCRQLELSAARALKKISLQLEPAQDQTGFEFVKEVHQLLPQVEQVSIICCLRDDIPTSCFGYTKAFKCLLDSAENRPHPISIYFSPRSIEIGVMMAGWLDALSPDFCSSSEYGIQMHPGSPWKRTISKGQASVTLICDVTGSVTYHLL